MELGYLSNTGKRAVTESLRRDCNSSTETGTPVNNKTIAEKAMLRVAINVYFGL
jgi:hypothetical protein